MNITHLLKNYNLLRLLNTYKELLIKVPIKSTFPALKMFNISKRIKDHKILGLQKHKREEQAEGDGIWTAFPGGSDSKESPAMQETWIRFLGWEGLLEKWTATHSSILTWSIPWTEEPESLQSMGSQWVSTTERFALTSLR